MMRKLSSPVRRDIDSDDIVVEDLKEVLTSHEDIDKKVAHTQRSTKEL